MISSTRAVVLVAPLGLGCAVDSQLADFPADTRNVLSTCATQSVVGLELLNDFDDQQQASFSFYANPNDDAGMVCDATGCARYPHPGEIGPDPGSPVESPATEATAECRTRNAVHLRGGGYTSYGPNFGWSVGAAVADAKDVSRFNGVSFWAKAGEGAVGQRIQVMLYDTHTYPVAERELRKCVEAVAGTTPAIGSGCYNGGHSERELGPEWHFYTLDFEEFKQETWGAKSPGGRPDVERLMRVEVKMPVNDSFDIWVDNLAWFTR